MPELKLIVGLGNPGRAYEKSRHNLGQRIVGELAKEYKLRFKRSLLFNSLFAQAEIEKQAVIFALPLTFMNNSGSALKKIIARKKIPLKDLLVVCDDINLPLGALRIRPKGSSGGHKGLKSVAEYLRAESFCRLRVGIKSFSQDEDLRDFVLSGFSQGEEKALKPVIKNAKECILTWLKEGAAKAMNKFN